MSSEQIEHGKPIEQYESFKTAITNIVKNSNRTHVSHNTRSNYITAVTQYVQFVNSEEGKDKDLTPDSLIEEAKHDIEKAKERIRLFFLWLQQEPIPGFKPWNKKVLQTSAFVKAYATVRGFYTNNNIIFGKWKTPSLIDMKKEAISNDTTVPFFKLDKKRKIYLDRAIVKQFLSNLKLRDQAIFLAILSSSHDSGDLFRLNLGDFRKQKDRERFYWEGQRAKTEVRFKTFFSVEATKYVAQYIMQERAEAKDNEPLFVTSGRKNRMTAAHLSAVFRDSARKMGLPVGNGSQNVFRPKRLRHVFRTGMTHAHVDEGYIHVFMGHRSSISQMYLDKDISILELEYSKAEPFLTIFGVGETGLEEIATELAEWKSKYADLNIKVEDLTTKLNEMYQLMDSKIEEVTIRIQREFYEKQVKQSDLDELKMQEEVSSEEEFTSEDKEQIERAKETKKALEQKEKDSSTKTIKTDEEPKEELSPYDLLKEAEKWKKKS